MSTIIQHGDDTFSTGATKALYEENTEVDLEGEDSDENILMEDERDASGAEKAITVNEHRSGTEASFVNVLKDFFRSTFSDQYPTESYCCGGSELITVMPGGAYCCKGQFNNRIAPESFDAIQSDDPNNQLLELQHSISQSSETGAPRTPPRKKALAVATGYKYAEDMDGRPVVIVPGTRKSPIDLTTYSAHTQYLRKYNHAQLAARRASLVAAKRLGRQPTNTIGAHDVATEPNGTTDLRA